MDEIHVTGKASLSGEIFIQGSKNAALPMIAASLMHRGLSILRGCPRISDVFCMEEILKSLGAVTWWDDHDLYLDCSCADGTEIPAVYTGRMRSSIILAGAVLARNRKCEDRVSGRMYDREKTNRFPSYGTESTWRGCPGKCIRPGWRMCQI